VGGAPPGSRIELDPARTVLDIRAPDGKGWRLRAHAAQPAAAGEGSETGAELAPGSADHPVVNVSFWDGDPASEQARVPHDALARLRADAGPGAAEETGASAEAPREAESHASAETSEEETADSRASVEGSKAQAEDSNASAEAPEKPAPDRAAQTAAPQTADAEPEAGAEPSALAGEHVYLLVGSSDGSAGDALTWLARHLPPLGYRTWPDAVAAVSWESAARGEKGLEYPWGNESRSGLANVAEKRDKPGPWFLEQTTAVGVYSIQSLARGVAIRRARPQRQRVGVVPERPR